MNKIGKYLKSRTVWMGLIAAALNIMALAGLDNLAGMPIDELARNKEVMASQITVIAAGAFDLLTILFRIKAKAKFE